MEVSVRQLKDHLSAYLRRAKFGEEILVLSRGRPVGRLLAPEPDVQATDKSPLDALHTLPGIRPGNGKPIQGSDQPINVPPGTSDAITDWIRGT